MTIVSSSHRFLFVLFLVLILPGVSLAARSAPVQLDDIPLPPGAVLVPAQGDTVHNGTLLLMAGFHTTATLTEVQDFYRQAWRLPARANWPGYIESSVPGWWVISRLEGTSHRVVQVKVADRAYHASNLTAQTHGYLSIVPVGTQPLQAPVVFQSDDVFNGYPLMTETRVQSTTEHSTLRLYQSVQSPARTTRQLLTRLQRKGWQALVTSQSKSQGLHYLEKNGRRLELTVQPASTQKAVTGRAYSRQMVSVIVVHEVAQQ